MYLELYANYESDKTTKTHFKHLNSSEKTLMMFSWLFEKEKVILVVEKGFLSKLKLAELVIQAMKGQITHHSLMHVIRQLKQLNKDQEERFLCL